MNRRTGLSFVVIASVGVTLAAVPQRATDTANPLAGNPAAIAAGDRLFQQTVRRMSRRSQPRAVARDRHVRSRRRGRPDRPDDPRPACPGRRCRRSPRSRPSRCGSWFRSFAACRAPTRRPASSANAAPGARAGDPALGETLFFGRGGCASCHEVNGRGGIVGPDLSAAGLTRAEALRQKILDPSNPAAAGRRWAWRSRRRPAAGRRRTNEGRPGDPRRAPERRHVLAADGGRNRPASSARQVRRSPACDTKTAR